MAIFNSVQDGAWDSISTWDDGTTYPQAGDEFHITHNVTITGNQSAGVGGIDNDIKNNATLLLDVGSTFTLTGRLTIGTFDRSSWGALVLSPGATFTDDGQSRNITRYNAKIISSGTPDNWCFFTGTFSITNNLGSANLHPRVDDYQYTSINLTQDLNMGSRNSSDGIFTSYLRLQNVVIEDVPNVLIGNASSNGDVTIDKVDLRGCGPSTFYDEARGEDTRSISNITWKGCGQRVFRMPATYSNLINLDNSTVQYNTDGGATFNGFFTRGSNGDGANTFVLSEPCTFNDSYSLHEGINTHGWSVADTGITVNRPTMEDLSTASGGGNAIVPSDNSVSTFNKLLLISDTTQLTGTGTAGDSATITINRPTIHSETGGTGGQNALFTFENNANPPTTDNFSCFNGLVSAGPTQAITALIGETTSDFGKATLDYFSRWNVTSLTEGTVDAVITNEVGLTSGPAYVDSGRGVLSWVDFINGTPRGTATVVEMEALLGGINGYDEVTGTQISENETGVTIYGTPNSLNDWVRAGFAPTNQELKGVASDGGDLGAMDVYIYVPPVSGDFVPTAQWWGI